MSVTFGSNFIVVSQTWTQLKTILFNKGLSLQWDYDSSGTQYQLFALDGSVVYSTFIYLGTVPDTVAVTYSQTQNNQDLADFQNNFKSGSNLPVVPFQQGDERWYYKLGNLTSTSSLEQFVSTNGYYEPQSQAQRGVKSTSTNDILGGSGAATVRITYLDSNYVQHIEDVALNGTNVVPTVNNNIRFIQSFRVIRGTAAAGRVILCTGSNGLGEICSIGAGSPEAFLAHHYIPSGSQAQTIEWDVTVNASANVKLKGQRWTSGSLVDPIFYDLENIIIAGSGTYNFIRQFQSNPAQEKTRVYVTVAPFQSTTAVVRARLNIWQDYLYVSGSS